MPNPEPLLVSTALLEQAEQMSRRQLASDPDKRTALAALGKTCRKLGKLDEARAAYERLAALDPGDSESAYMLAILAGTDVPVPPAAMHSAPFVVIKNFLPRSFHETLLPFVLSVQDKLEPAKVSGLDGQGAYNPDMRESLELPGECDVKTRFGAHIGEILPAIIPRLHVPPFEIGNMDVKVRAYLDGHFFKVHMDSPPQVDKICRRKVSFTYFFHNLPRGYTGGDLLLFDTHLERNRFTTSGFTSIAPEDNLLVLFPSPYYHSVVPVSCPSKLYVNSRFVINGHVSSPRAPGDSATPDAGEPQAAVPA
jgi:Rps23 Pro-64 3,4-dihydroxylase Tpa1-like proline 4-hydroxylase